jgi:hypothetical protein
MANVNFYGPLQQALMGATPKLTRIKPTAISPQAGWVGAAAQIAEGALKGFQQRREDQDRSAIMAALTAQPELTTPLSPYLANQREAQQRLTDPNLRTDPNLGFDPSQLYSPEGLTEIDLNQENRFAPNLGLDASQIYSPNLGLDASQLDPQEESAEFESGLVGALPQVNDPEMMSALIGDVISEEQERENLRPAARQDLLRNLDLKTPAGRRIRDQTLIGQLAQNEADRKAAELLKDERAFLTTQAANLAKSKNDEARAGGSSETYGKTPVWGTNPEGEDVIGVISDQSNFKVIETPEGFFPDRDITADRAEDTARVARLTNRVDKGIAAAESLPVLKRTLELLKGVKTGGFASMQIKARRLFGVEGANEAELSYALGKSVLSQLKSTFGSAFTAGESDKLEALEAGLGKSPEGNMRIIENLIRQSEQFYRQGRKAAFESNDLSTYEAMADAYGLTYGPSGDGNGNDAGKSSRPNPSNYTGTDAQWNALPKEDQDLYF